VAALCYPAAMPQLLLLPLILACGGDDAAPAAAPRDAPTATGSTARTTLDRVRVKADLSAIRSAVRTWSGMNEGALPPDVAALGLQGLQYPDAYTYDASTGEVHCAELPDL
jgi:hypothetical protein